MTTDILQAKAEEFATERAQWIDETIKNSIPEWKRNILQKYPYNFIKKLLRVNVEVRSEELIADFGERVIIINNGQYIAARKFKYQI